VAAQLGYCGLDRQRTPLTGDEIRPCWEAADANAAAIPALPGVGAVWPLGADDDRTAVRSLEFVEVPTNAIRPGLEPSDATAYTPVEPATETIFLTPGTGGEPRWSLWGEPEA
jgi:hypothetical protein